MEKLSMKITDLLVKKNCIEQSMYSIYQYGTQMTLEIACSFLTSILICGMCGMLVEGLIFFAVFIPLRSYLGGFHMKSYWACFLCSAAALIGILSLVRFLAPGEIVSWALLLVSSFGVFLEARADSRLDEEGKYFYPRICMLILAILMAGTVFWVFRDFSKLFLLACTVALVAVSKLAVWITKEKKRHKAENSGIY